MNKKNLLFNGLLLVLFSFLYSCSGIEANVDITVPKGPKGDSGLSAYEVWKESVNNGVVNWPKDEVEVNDFFRYLKGKDGKDGKDGKSAYDQWKESIATGNVEDPHNPGQKWDSSKNTVKDFWKFLAGKDGKNGLDGKDGKDGKNGLSAYELWAKDLADNCGKAGQLMDPHNPSQPWTCDKNTMKDFWQYLRGVDGQSAYALWKEKVLDGTIQWPKNEVAETDFFRYLKGKDGKDGRDGLDGLNGLDGKSAYDIWKEFIASGDVDHPHKPGEKWDRNKNKMQDFFAYLTGAKGDQGKSAYELWKQELETRCGTADPMKNPHNPTQDWPCGEKSMADYLRYLRGVDGASAYDIWKKAVEAGTITWAGSRDTAGFFLYLKGEKGEKGDPGKNGASAYEIWKEFIKDGNAPNPHGPGNWSATDNSEQHFWRYLAGPKGDKGDNGNNGINGENGKSAYQLWKEQVEANCGNVVTQVMNPHDPTKVWPCDRVSQNDFWDYLRGPKGSDGKDGKDGEPGQAVELGRPNVLPIFFNGKLREYVDPTDGSVRFQVFDKNGTKVGPGVKVKGIPGLANQNKEFETDAEGKIKVLREDLPVKFAPGQRAGKALVDLEKNGNFEETAPNILTPNRIFTRIKMEFAYLRQLYNSSWTRAFPNNFTVVLYKYERQVDDRWEEYPVGLPTPDTETVKILNHTQPIVASNVTADPEWGKSTLGILPYDKKDGKTHIFYRPVVLTPSEIKAKNENLDIHAEHRSGWLRDQWNMNRKYSWDNVARYMTIRGVANFYGEAPIMDAAVHVPEIYATPSLSATDLKMQIKTGTTSLWGYLKATDQELPEFYLKYNEPVGNLWSATKMAGSQLPEHTHIGIGMTKNWNGGGGSSYVAIKPKVYPTVAKFLLNDTYPGNFIGAYSYLTDAQGGVTLGKKDERVLQGDWVPYRDSAFYKLVTDSNDLSNPGNIRIVDLFDKTIEISVTKEDAPANWVIVK